MGWGEPHGPTTRELEEIDGLLTAAGVPARDDNGFAVTLAERVRMLCKRAALSASQE